MNEESDTQQRASKKFKASNDLKSFTADVKIIVGKGKDKREYPYHAQQLASISPWMDEQLSDMLKEEKDIHEITLEDIKAEVWLAMIKFIVSPLEARKMTKEDVFVVVAGYHKYDFPQGLAVCDQVLWEYMRTLEPQDKLKILDVESTVTEIAAAHKYHLAKAKKTGAAFVKKILRGSRFQRDLNVRESDFAPSDIEKLIPTMESLVEQDHTFLSHILPVNSSYRCETVEDIHVPTFPHIFCMAWRAYHSGDRMKLFFKHFQLCGAVWEGNLIEDFKFTWSDGYSLRAHNENKNFFIDGDRCVLLADQYGESGWKIYAHRYAYPEDVIDPPVLWKADLGGKHEELPPETGWQAVHPLASGSPKIKLLGP